MILAPFIRYSLTFSAVRVSQPAFRSPPSLGSPDMNECFVDRKKRFKNIGFPCGLARPARDEVISKRPIKLTDTN